MIIDLVIVELCFLSQITDGNGNGILRIVSRNTAPFSEFSSLLKSHCFQYKLSMFNNLLTIVVGMRQYYLDPSVVLLLIVLFGVPYQLCSVLLHLPTCGTRVGE